MKEITLTISAQTLNAIGAALNELPYKVAAPALQEIDKQVQAALALENGGGRGSSKVGSNGNSDGTSNVAKCADSCEAKQPG